MVICKCSHMMEYIGVDTIKKKYDMYQVDVKRENRIDALVYYECECGWKDVNLIDTRKVNIYNLKTR